MRGAGLTAAGATCGGARLLALPALLVLLVLLAAPAAADPGASPDPAEASPGPAAADSEPSLESIEAAADVLRLLRRGGFDAALALRDQLPTGPDGAVARAALAYIDGDYGAAVDLLPAGPAPTDFAGDLLDRALKAQRAVAGMVEVPLGNFRFRHLPGPDGILVPYAARPLEAERQVLLQLFGEVPGRDIVVEFLPDITRFCLATGLPETWVRTTGTVAVAKWDRLMVLSPLTSARGYPWLDTLAHEYVHLALSRLSEDQAPIWLQEGAARYLESRWRSPRTDTWLDLHSESLLARGIEDDALVPFAKMHPSMAALPSAEVAALAYAQVAFAVGWIFEDAGPKGFRRVIDNTIKTGDALRAADIVMGAGGFEKNYLARLRKAGFTARSAVKHFEPEFDDDYVYIDGKLVPPPGGRAADPTDDPVLLADRAMNDHRKLGDLLRRRGRPLAALIEYDRAADVGAFHSPALANKRARALLSLGRPEDAERTLAETVALYPEYTPTVALHAEVLHRLGRRSQAADAAVQAIALNPFDPTPHAILATLYEAGGDTSRLEQERAVLAELEQSLGVRPVELRPLTDAPTPPEIP